MTEQKHSACPFCGGEVDPTGWLRGDGARGPECEGCGATAPSMEVWEQRACLVPEEVRSLLSRAQCEIESLAECLENVCEDEEDVDVREDVADGRVVAADIAHFLAAAPAQGGAA